MNEYEVFIEDLVCPEETDIKRGDLIKIINKELGKGWARETKIEVKPEWKKILREDGSILWSYQKLGWKAMHYQQQKSDGSCYEWLSFKNPKYKGEKVNDY